MQLSLYFHQRDHRWNKIYNITNHNIQAHPNPYILFLFSLQKAMGLKERKTLKTKVNRKWVPVNHEDTRVHIWGDMYSSGAVSCTVNYNFYTKYTMMYSFFTLCFSSSCETVSRHDGDNVAGAMDRLNMAGMGHVCRLSAC